MYRQENIKPYKKEGSKGQQVEQMFDTIAPSYDKLNHHLSWNIDRYWRKKAVSHLSEYAPKTILDVATGTGDFAILMAKHLRPTHIDAVDISEGMMEAGREKVSSQGMQAVIEFCREDCMALSLPDNKYDAVTATFGIRNFPDLEKGLKEMYRVLKPGGRLCILELTHPVHFPMRQLFWLYSHTILPLYGKLISKDKSAYTYLTNTIQAFPQGEEMVEVLRKIGYLDAHFKRYSSGICTLLTATKE